MSTLEHEKKYNPLIDQFVIYKEISGGRSQRTCDKYRRYLIKLDAFLDETAIDAADTEQLINFTGMHAYKVLNLSPSGRWPLLAAVRTFYAWLSANQKISKDPAMNIPYPKKGRPLPVGMQLSNAEQILKFPDMDTFIGVRDLAILGVLIGCGPRVSGVCKLNESDLIFSRDQDGNECLSIRFVEKGGRERILPAPDQALLMMRIYLGHHDLDKIDRNIENDRVLFVSTRNRTIPEHEYYGEMRRIRTKVVDRLIKRYGTEAGIPADQLSAHAFRHLFGTELAEDDVSTLVMQSLLGHADPKTTEIYSHLALRKLREVVNKSSPLVKIKSPVSGLRSMLKLQT